MLSRAPDFWWRRHSLAGYALAPLGALYGRVSARRMTEAGAAAAVPVICVGNLVLGGAGKTPMALHVAKVCSSLGRQPGFLSRGYRGRERGPVVVAPAHRAEDVGDEPLLLAQNAPTVVSADRPSGAKLLASLGVDVIIMDDGFQNPSLAKDLSLVVVDAGRGIGNGFVFPAGPLRAPLLAQLRQADAVILLGEGDGGRGMRAAARAGLPILRARAEAARRRGLKRRPYLAFAGIADPGKFYRALAAAGADVPHTMSFPDHHSFTEAECESILGEAMHRGLVPITTEKDRMRLGGRGGAAERLAATTEVFPILLRFDEPRRLETLVANALAAHGDVYRRTVLTGGAATALA